MRSPSASLARLYFKTIYGIKPLSSYTRPRDRLKLAGIVLLSLVLLGDFGFIFVSSAIAQYDALKPQGLEGLLLLNAAMTASMIVFGSIRSCTWRLTVSTSKLVRSAFPAQTS